MRFNALSRTIESALQKEGILSRVLGGHKFFERAEVRLSLLVWICCTGRDNWNNLSHRSRTFWHICKLSTTPTSSRDFRGRLTRQIEVSETRLLVDLFLGHFLMSLMNDCRPSKKFLQERPNSTYLRYPL